jgi:capsule polysaccharide modification protein KpsS
MKELLLNFKIEANYDPSIFLGHFKHTLNNVNEWCQGTYYTKGKLDGFKVYLNTYIGKNRVDHLTYIRDMNIIHERVMKLFNEHPVIEMIEV